MVVSIGYLSVNKRSEDSQKSEKLFALKFGFKWFKFQVFLYERSIIRSNFFPS